MARIRPGKQDILEGVRIGQERNHQHQHQGLEQDTGMQDVGSSINRQAKVMIPHHSCVFMVIQRADEDIIQFLPPKKGRAIPD